MWARRTLLAVIACLCLGWAAPAAAYIMPADALARLWADRRAAGWREMSLRVAVVVGDGQAPAHEARLSLKRPERMRWQPQDRRQPTVLDVEGRRSHGVGRHPEGEVRRSPSLWLAWLLPRGRKGDDVAPRLAATLKAFGVDAAQVALARFEGGIVYIVGARPGDESPPQLWLDKATLLPVRTLVDVDPQELPLLAGEQGVADWSTAADGEAGDGPGRAVRLDTRLLGWGAGPGGERVPQAIEHWLAGRRLCRWEVRHARRDARLSDALFRWGAERRG